MNINRRVFLSVVGLNHIIKFTEKMVDELHLSNYIKWPGRGIDDGMWHHVVYEHETGDILYDLDNDNIIRQYTDEKEGFTEPNPLHDYMITPFIRYEKEDVDTCTYCSVTKDCAFLAYPPSYFTSQWVKRIK